MLPPKISDQSVHNKNLKFTVLNPNKYGLLKLVKRPGGRGDTIHPEKYFGVS